MLESCLPATGPEGWVIALLVAVGVVLLVAGAVFLARSKARMAMLMVPVAALALVLAAPAQPSQAIAPIPGFTVPGDWHHGSTIEFDPDDPYTPEQLAALEQLDELTSQTTFLIEVVGDGEGETGTLPDSALEFEGFLPVIDGDTFDALAGDWEFPILMTVTFTSNYVDDCGKPAQTVIVWTGQVAFPA